MSIQGLTAFLKQPTAEAWLDGVDDHAMPMVATELARQNKGPVVLVAGNHGQLSEFISTLRFLSPDLPVLPFPSWDVQPYDRLSADVAIQARRLKTLAMLSAGLNHGIIVTTAAALSTKVPPLGSGAAALSYHLRPGDRLDREALGRQLVATGYHRVGTVMESGEFAIRGSLLDIYPASERQPYRIDLFDDEIETIRQFDPADQRSGDTIQALTLHAASEVVLNDETIKNFRQQYRGHFPAGMDDALYQDVSAGRSNPLMGHYLPLFYDQSLATLFDFLPPETVLLTGQTFQHAVSTFQDQVADAYQARQVHQPTGRADDADLVEESYRPIPPELLYLTATDWQTLTSRGRWLHHGLLAPDDNDTGTHLDAGLQSHLPLVSQKTAKRAVSTILAEQVEAAGKRGDVVVISAFTPSSLERIKRLLEEHDIHTFKEHSNWAEATRQKGLVNMLVGPLSWGFYDAAGQLFVLTEQDIFGEKQNTSARRPRRKNEDIIAHFSELSPGDLVVHAEHGIGRFAGLETLTAGGNSQDFICLEYESRDKLYVPVVALDLLSRYSGAEASDLRLDKLGGAAWQARKAKVKKRLLEMAGDLIKVAAARQLRKRPPYQRPHGLYDEFVAGFPYVATAEQQQAIDDVEGDLYGEQPMDRLVVGDVGFGKTEVALRAAFIAAADGRQVAIIAPTTLLARQHVQVFKQRFQNFPLRVAGLSRLTSPAEAKRVKEALATGGVDIVIGTHALLSKSVKFANLGMVVIDEEQRFGVGHKEKLKQLRETVDVLTLTATPIPRTLHMSMSGLKELSTITTPPVDRLAVRTFVLGFDSKVLREAILREIFRGGQVYVVTPRVDGLEKLAQSLREIVPEAKVRTAHGQMDRASLEDVMNDFYDGQFNVLVATTIIESGLDLPTANTMIIHRADRFGLAQLYQLRGRVGRSKARAYAYLLVPPGGRMTEDAHQRLQILRRLEGLGAGFTLASYDMDLRGPGNLLGAEQSGYIREVGFELYNQMLQDALRQLRAGSADSQPAADAFTPQLNLGMTFRIPEGYVTDLNTRMTLYRRLAHLHTEEDLQNFHDELLDRFGPLPKEVDALFEVMRLRDACRKLNIEKIEVGDKGVLIAFYQDKFANPEGLLHYILRHPGILSLRADQKVIWHRRWPDSKSRLRAIQNLLSELQELTPTTATTQAQQAHG